MIFPGTKIDCFVCHDVDRAGSHLSVQDTGDHSKVYCHLLGDNSHCFHRQVADDVQIVKL